MLTAHPGRGRITRVTLNDKPKGPGYAGGQLVPYPNDADALAGHVKDDDLVPLVHHVDLVLAHDWVDHATGLILTLEDADAAYMLSEAALRAAEMLSRRVQADELDGAEAPAPQPVEALVRRCERCHRVTTPRHPEGLQGRERVHEECLASYVDLPDPPALTH